MTTANSTTSSSNEDLKRVLRKKNLQIIEYLSTWRTSELHCISFYKSFLFYQGLLPSRDLQPGLKIGIIYRKWMPRVLSWAFIYCALFGMPLFIYTIWGKDRRLSFEVIGSEIIAVMIYSHYLCLHYYSNNVKIMFEALDDMRECGKLLPRQPKDIVEQTRKWTEMTFIVFVGFILVLGSFLILIPNALTKRELLFYSWYPFDDKQSPFYEIVFVLTIVIFAYAALSILCNVHLLITLLLEATGQLKLLSYNLENIFDSKGHEITNKNDSNAHFSENSTPNLTCIDVLSLDRQKEDEIVSKCVQHHHLISRFIGEFEVAYSLVLATLVAGIVLSPGLAVKVCFQADSADKAAVMGTVLLLAANSYFAQLCLRLDTVAQESELARDAVFGSDWLDASDRSKRSMRIIMSRSNQPLVVRVAGFIPLTLETYYEVMKLTYTYCMTFLKIISVK